MLHCCFSSRTWCEQENKDKAAREFVMAPVTWPAPVPGGPVFAVDM